MRSDYNADPGLFGTQTTGLARILPSTRDWLAFVRDVQGRLAGATALVGRSAEAGMLSPQGLLRAVASGSTPHLIFIFADQLTTSHDATVLVHSDHGDHYVCPLEFILHTNYGYVLSYWGAKGERLVDARSKGAPDVLAPIAAYLNDCSALGEEWLARSFQHERSPEFRREEALRKLRYFKSVVADAFRNDPLNADATSLMTRATSLEMRLRPERIA